MHAELPAHRQKAIDDYLALAAEHPDLFPQRSARPLVLDRARLTEFARTSLAKQGENATVFGLAARTPWHLFVVDVVATARGELMTYDRLVPASVLYRRCGIAVVATSGRESGNPNVVLIRIERHATGLPHWEIPRGYGEPHLSPEGLAIKELAEEAGYQGRVIRRLGQVHTNTGQTEEQLIFFHVELTGDASAHADEGEIIHEVRLWPVNELWKRIQAGEITDSFTIQGLALLEHCL